MDRKRHLRGRLSYRKPKSSCGQRVLVDVEDSEELTDQDLGYKMAEGLMERKPELIGKWIVFFTFLHIFKHNLVYNFHAPTLFHLSWPVDIVTNIVPVFLEVLSLLLAVRVVKVLGRAKALQVYKQTQDVERDGGLMILVSYYL